VRVAVTGASGFIGSALCRLLVERGHEITSEGFQALVHLAGIAHRHAPASEIRRVNVDLAVRKGREAAAAGAHMIFMSSVKVHGDRSTSPLTEKASLRPGDAYAESKVAAERALRDIPDLKLTVLRPTLVYGPGVKANFFSLMRAVARGLPLPLASVDNRRSLLFVGNLADAVIRCLESPAAAGRTYLVSDGEAVSTARLCRELGEALGRRARLFPFPPALLPGKLAGSLEVDDAAIRTELGWKPPLTRRAGLEATARWYLRG
jgi:nucleoside-diphosphate-sugar epimerase